MYWRREDAIFRAQLRDAQRDLRLWLSVAESNEERFYLREIAENLADLERTADHRVLGLASDDEERRWDSGVRFFLDRLHKAKEVRGCVVGKYLSRLASQLDGQAGSKPEEHKAAKQSANGDRRAEVNAYIAEVLEKTGKKISRKDIWKKAGYTTRTEFERWERQDPKHPNEAAAKSFSRVLREKPHLS